MKPPFPEYVDSTMRSCFVGCEKKFFYEYLMNRRTEVSNVHLTAGKAFAAGLETTREAFWTNNMSEEDALMAGTRRILESYTEPERFDNHVKSLTNTIGALHAYFEHWGFARDEYQPMLRKDGGHAIEFSFAIPLEGTAHPDTGLPIIYCGRADWIGVHEQTGLMYAVDEKTTTRLGPTWPDQWRHRAQLTGYVWAARQYGIELDGALVRGISFLKNSYGHAESLQLRSAVYVDRWREQIVRDVNRMVELWKTNEFGYNFSDNCNSYSSPCTFTDACGSRDPEEYVRYNFSHYRWNPLEHQVEELNDENEVVRIVE